jgi:alpha-beta hydrolase superfamily lysophospholipase
VGTAADGTDLLGRRTFLAGALAVAGASLAGCRRSAVGRAVVVHGLGSTARSYRTTAPFKGLVEGFAVEGWAVDVMSYRTEGRGPAHAAALQSLFDQDSTGANVLDLWLEDYERHVAGLAPVDGPTILVGISWGGLLALQAAGRGRVRPDAFIAHIPATEPRLIEEFSSYDLSVIGRLDESALTMPGLLSWATDDERTGYRATAALADRLGCDRKQYESLGHNTTGEVVAHLTGWAGRQRDQRRQR